MSNAKQKPQPKKEQRPFTLRAVYLREAKQWMSDSFDPTLPGQQLIGQVRSSGSRIEVQEAIENTPNAETIKSCRITLNFEFRYLNKEPDPKKKEVDERQDLMAEISARITVDYLIGTVETPPKEKLEQWASGNALLHAWPYWREFCHSTLLRMNLPVTMMPMLEMNQKKED